MFTLVGDIVTENGVLTDGALTIDDGKIVELMPSPHSADFDASGCLILPGFVDLHIHGGGGADFMDGTPDAVRQVCRTHARFGTTSLLATTMTASRAVTDAAIAAVRQVVESGQNDDEARIVGIHLEGPYINVGKRGAQPEEFVRPPDVAEFMHWLERGGGLVKQITLAPEIAGAEELIKAAREANVNVSLGHTDATAVDVETAIEWGANQATHTFNAMRGLHHREPGTVGAVLTRPELLAEAIADGVHLHPLVVQLILAAKGVNGATLITDAIEGVAMPDGEWTLGGQTVYVRNGTAAFADGTLAGSVLTMNRAFRNAMTWANLTPVQASRFASANAARQLGMDSEIGRLEVGKRADIVILDPQTGDVALTLIGGKTACRR